MATIDKLARLPIWMLLFFLAVRRHPTAALKALAIRLRGKKVRSLNILRKVTQGEPSLYKIWLAKIEPTLCNAMKARSARDPGAVLILVFQTPTCSEKMVEQTLASLPSEMEVALVRSRGQAHQKHLSGRAVTCVHPDDFNTFISAVKGRGGDTIIVPIRAGDCPSTVAPALYAEALRQAPTATICYGDEDQVNLNGWRAHPWFKPEWNFDQFLAQDYISGACAIPIGRIPEIDLTDADDPVALLAYATIFAHTPPTVIHSPNILSHRRPRDGSLRDVAVRNILAMKLPPDTIISDGRGHTRRILWPSPSPPPLVTAVVPTRDRLDLLTQCLTGLCATQYPALEIVIVDNDSEQPETLAYFEKVQQQGVKVLHYDGPFNFAAMNNAAAAMASGEYLCLINNDIEFVDPTWLTTMVRQAARHHVGAVGAKLLFPDFTLQHAGVAIGLGGAAGHMHKHMPETSDACHNEPHVQRAVSAVTAACLLLSKRKFLEVGGFDAEAFAVAFNDVDLCLKLQRAGYTNIYEPFALAVHHESQSRGDDLSHVNLPRYLKELSALQQRWNTKCATDPNWHPNFVYSCEQKVLHV